MNAWAVVVVAMLAASHTGESLNQGDEHCAVTGEEEGPCGRTGDGRQHRALSAMAPGDGWAGQRGVFGDST